MNTHIAECPKCRLTIATTPHEAARGLKCGECGTGFIPTKLSRLDPDAPEKPQSVNAQWLRVKGRAQLLSILGAVAFILAMVIVAFSIWQSKAGGNGVEGFYTAGCFCAASIVLFLFAQLLHIRAALERR